jgi:hypothetical protein
MVGTVASHDYAHRDIMKFRRILTDEITVDLKIDTGIIPPASETEVAKNPNLGGNHGE